jgi:glycosyltransferase involved in cell wall biosynthesis
MGADPATTRTIPNGVDSSIFYPRNRETFRKKVNVSPKQKMIVSAGALIERKGHHHVLRAVSRLVAVGADVCLVIVGGTGREGDFSATLKRMPAELQIENRVFFLGQVTPDQMAEAMSAADLFCLASSREGWPNVVHEAMACGTPVVATNVGGTPEMIPSATYGTVIPKDDQDALESAIKTALAATWDRDRICQWAHSRSWENVAGEVLELFQKSQTAIAKRQ